MPKRQLHHRPPAEGVIFRKSTQRPPLQDTIHLLNLFLGRLATFFTDQPSDKPFTIRSPKLRQKPVHKRGVKASLTIPVLISPAKVKEKAKRAKRHLTTPIGKVAAINSLALLGLFAFVMQQQPPIGDQQLTRDVGAVTQQTLRQYQPSVGVVSSSVTAFNETVATQDRQLPLYTWVTPWNLDSVQANLASYKGFSAFWMTVESDGSTLSTKGNWAGWEQLIERRKEGQSTTITITGDPDWTYLTLSNTTAQEAFITNVIKLLNEKNAGGVDINFEALGSDNRELFTAFVRNLAAALKPLNKQVVVTLEARLANVVPMDWRNIGQIADEVRIMAYDYHARNTGYPGPIAPLGWVKEVVDYAVSQIDPTKIVVGLGNYGYNWVAPESEGGTWAGVGLSFERATSLATELEVPILRATGIDERGYDIGTIPYFSYTDKADGKMHSVWFEDATSLGEKVALLSQYPLRGVIFWSVGIGDSQFWINRSTPTSTP